MLDARYHLFYSIAVFLMLGFGILIGASYYGPVQVGQQKKVVRALADETNKVVQQRNEIQGRLDKDELALEALRPGLVHGKLAGKRVMLVQTGDYAEATQDANIALGDAGATVAATVVLTGRWGVLTPKQRTALATVAGSSDTSAQDAALLAALAAALAAGTDASPSSAATVEALQQQELITLSGDLSKPCALFVVIGGNNDDMASSTLDGPLLDGFKSVSSSLIVVGGELSSAASSSVPAYQAAGVATVDCLDLPLGQLALPFALRGERGDYGVKPTAKQPIPSSLTELSTEPAGGVSAGGTAAP